MMNLYELQEEVDQWTKHNFPQAESWQPLLGIGEELGELNHAYLKSAQGVRVGENYRAKMVDAVGDILIVLAHFCSLMNIDMDAALDATWHEVSRRDWIRFPKNGISE